MKIELLSKLLNFLLPKSGILEEIDGISKENLYKKASYKKIEKAPFAESVFAYKDKDVKNLIWALKYYRQRNVAEIFGIFLYEAIIGNVGEDVYLENFDEPILIPIPISRSRKLERGYNQAEELIKEIERCDTEKIFSSRFDILLKKSDSSHLAHTQTKIKREEKIKDSFYIKNSGAIKNKNIILIDDVITTGSTLKEARKVLLENGAKKVKAFAVAH